MGGPAEAALAARVEGRVGKIFLKNCSVFSGAGI
jgi:hypothetical protein